LAAVHAFGDHAVRILVGVLIDFAILPKLSTHFKGQGELEGNLGKSLEQIELKKINNHSITSATFFGLPSRLMPIILPYRR
jgi:hypothetical protein